MAGSAAAHDPTPLVEAASHGAEPMDVELQQTGAALVDFHCARGRTAATTVRRGACAGGATRCHTAATAGEGGRGIGNTRGLTAAAAAGGWVGGAGLAAHRTSSSSTAAAGAGRAGGHRGRVGAGGARGTFQPDQPAAASVDLSEPWVSPAASVSRSSGCPRRCDRRGSSSCRHWPTWGTSPAERWGSTGGDTRNPTRRTLRIWPRACRGWRSRSVTSWRGRLRSRDRGRNRVQKGCAGWHLAQRHQGPGVSPVGEVRQCRRGSGASLNEAAFAMLQRRELETNCPAGLRVCAAPGQFVEKP